MTPFAHSTSKLQYDSLNSMSFPIRMPLEPDESGRGYLLRLCALNSVEAFIEGTPPVKVRGANLSELDAPLISHWFGESVPRLRWALGADFSLTNDRRTIFAGHRFSRPSSINRTRPRVCAECLLHDGVCRLSWEITLVTACHRHRVGLIDRCQVCQTSIRWSRPSPGSCHCYCFFSSSSLENEPQEVEFEFEHWVHLQARLKSPDAAIATEAAALMKAATPSSALMQVVWPMSLDAGLLITLALSTAAGSPFVPRVDSDRPRSYLNRAQAAIRGANELATHIQDQRYAQMYIGSSKKAFELIAYCLNHQFSPADRGFAQSLLITLTKRYKIQRWSSAKPQLSQFLLF